MDLLETAKRVKRGVKPLDKKVPNWRQVLRKHQDQFDFADGDHCVLGTLEHYSGRMRVLRAKNRAATKEVFTFTRAALALGITDEDTDLYGFDWDSQDLENRYDVRIALGVLWRAEFEQ